MDDLVNEFIEETSESLAVLDSELVTFEQNPHDEKVLGNIFRLVHTIKGTCGFLGLPRLESVAHAGENILGKIRDKELDVSQHAISLVLEALDHIKGLIEYLGEHGSEPVGSDEDLINRLNAFVDSGGKAPEAAAEPAPAPAAAAAAATEEESSGDALPEDALKKAKELAEGLPSNFDGDSDELQKLFDATPVATPASPAAEEAAAQPEAEKPAPAPVAAAPTAPPAPPAAETAEKKPAAAASQSIRVNLDVLEILMQTVGELVLTRNQLLQLERNTEDKKFTGPIQQLSHITSELQEQVMKTRMQPIGNAWAKFPRLIRDLSMELNKKIELRMVGAETELDRQLLEMIKDPLTHMVRNSADHGLETPEERVKAGKPESGTVTLSAYHEGGHIIILISDDGRGVNLDKVKEKIIGNGLATEEQLAEMPDNQIIQYIFKPGFSTAEKVTSVSGRGVGMDVVRSNIEKIGGVVELSSEPGKGSKFHIKIPLTLAIVSVLVLKAGEQEFAIPQINVQELVRTANDSNHRIEEINGSAVLRLREKLLPLMSLTEALGMEDKRDHELADNSYIVVCKVGPMEFGLVVDQIFDTEEIVVKPKSELLKDIDLYSGTTILGDGSVIMILDPNGLARCIGDQEGLKDLNEEKDQHMQEDLVSLLLFEDDAARPFAIPLELVARLEEISTDQIEYSDGKPVVQYRDALMRMITLDGSSMPTEGSCEVMVFHYDGSIMGVVVGKILDITEVPYKLKMQSETPGIIGNMVVNGKTTDIIDIGHYITQVFGSFATHATSQIQQKLLFVEDSPFFRNLTVPFLRNVGFDVSVAEDGEDALRKISESGYFDAIVTDIEMPRMDGFELAQQVKRMQDHAETPIFAFTSTVGEAFQKKARKIGFEDFIDKTNRPALIKALEGYIKADGSLSAAS
jgi:two-component system chemotaxis sensor kinase CheA